MKKIPGIKKTYRSINTVLKEDEIVDFPVEMLNSINLSGMPEHIIELKFGVPVMLLRNLNPPKLFNGSRFIVRGMNNNIIEAKY